jgi:hypothetical protein
VLDAVVGAVVEAFVRCQLDAVDEFDVGAFVDLVGVAGGEVGDEKAEGAAGCGEEGLAFEAIDDQRAVGDGGEGNAGVEIVGRRVEAEILGGRPRLDELQNSGEAHSVAFAAGDESADIGDLVLSGDGGKLREGERTGMGAFTGNREHYLRVQGSGFRVSKKRLWLDN